MLARGMGRRTGRCWFVVVASAQLWSGNARIVLWRMLPAWAVLGCLCSLLWDPGSQLLPFADGQRNVTCHPTDGGVQLVWGVGDPGSRRPRGNESPQGARNAWWAGLFPTVASRPPYSFNTPN